MRLVRNDENSPNQALRKELRAANITFWQIAKKLDVSEITITRWLRDEPLAEKKDSLIRNAMSAIIEERKGERNGN